MNKIKFLSTVATVTFLVACKSTDTNTYHWGNYDDVVYSYYNAEGDFARQEADLNKIITDAKAAGKPIPPGVYGHLGLVLLKQGKRSEANLSFQEEQKLYPESTKFMQYLQRHK